MTGLERASRILGQRFVRLNAHEAARRLEALPASDVAQLVDDTPTAAAVALIERLTPDAGAGAIARAAPETTRAILARLDPARAAALLARLDEDARDRCLALADPPVATELRALLAYPAETAGGLMDPGATALRPDASVSDALARIRERRRRVQDIFVVDGGGRLVGTVAIQDLATARPETRLDALVRSTPASVRAMATHTDVLDLMTQRRLASVPVVDEDDRLLGVIRYDVLVTTAQEEASADVQTMVGASRQERTLSPVGFAVRKRLPWLEINLATAFLAAAVVGLFESTIARFTALAVLLPVVAGQSGNTGAQALAVTMRGLALREVRIRHWPRITLKEASVALVNGVAVAITTSAGVLVWSGSSGLAVVIGVSMVISMVAAGLAGAAVPLALVALDQDPAQSSSIILTTITDVVGFFSFLGIATVLAWAL